MVEAINNSAAVLPAQVEPQAVAKKAEAVQPAQEAKVARAAEVQQEVSVEDLQAAIEQLNDFMKQGQRALSFSVDRSSEEVVVSVTDSQTEEVIRQIPSEEALKLKQYIDGVIGLLFNDKV